ncbi:MAG: permease prefix domain 1-containing protein [Dehalococcoidia bacterium]|nr:permease prefix domain 1-containing protein [Dehalococcoidia bacterium]
MPFEATNYLHTLARRLRLDPVEKDEIIQELEAHLEDKAAELETQGIDHDAAVSRAVQEMGAPNVVARRMYEVHSPGVWRDVILATIPHFLLASLFALHLWSHYFLVSLLLIAIAFVTWRNWRAGSPSKWSYSWMGYSLAAPALSWLLSLITLGYGAWTLLTTGQLPFNVVLFFLLIGYVPFSMWIMANVIFMMVKRDWLLASLTALPFPFLTSWILFLNWQGGLWSEHAERMQDSDTARAFIFVAMAVTTAVFLKVGPRLLRIGLLTVSTSILVIITVASLPVSLGALAVILMIVTSLAFLLSPAMLESKIESRWLKAESFSGLSEGWPPDEGFPSS